jgi:formate--tetrahydrofolate ligase
VVTEGGPAPSPAPLPARPADCLRPILEIGRRLGLRDDELEAYGPYKAKIRLEVLDRLADVAPGRLVLITAITPTRFGEGKTTTAIGLTDGLQLIGRRAVVALRQPTLGPVFGIKGGAAGSGRARVVPSDEMNLHLTGDSHAVQTAHNLAAAVLDNHLQHGNALDIAIDTISWPRATDISDRALRRARVGIGSESERDTSWVITSASEVMAVLALAGDTIDLRNRLGRIVVASRRDGSPVTLNDLEVAGSMAALLRDAIKPNLLQTLEGAPAIVHAGPFANIAHGCSSVLADRIALGLSEVVVTEAGFGADLGAEKFFDITCRVGRLAPAAAVLVASVRSLRAHGGGAGSRAVKRGAANLAHHVEILGQFGVPVIVAVNVFPDDNAAELGAVRDAAVAAGAHDAVLSRHVADGGAGAVDLASAVERVIDEPSSFRTLYDDDLPLVGKIERIARRVYGADGIVLAPAAAERLARLEADGYGSLPVCMAKTPLSLSHDPRLLGRPTGFRLPIRGAILNAGAGFITVLCGAIQLMPGLPARPASERIDLLPDGSIVGIA